MNLSGPVVNLYQQSQLGSKSIENPSNLIIIHDELDLQPSKVRLKLPPQSLKPKGHNGLKSILSSLKAFDSSRNLFTIGIGIGRDTSNLSRDHHDVARWVLGPLNRDEIGACSWLDSLDFPSLSNLNLSRINPSERGRVVLEVWQRILEVVQSGGH